MAFSQIANLERQTASDNTFRASETAAARMRLILAMIKLQSLPMPTIVPISGHGIFAEWKNGARAVEITAFADGDVVIEAMQDRIAGEQVSQEDPHSVLSWLVSGSIVDLLKIGDWDEDSSLPTGRIGADQQQQRLSDWRAGSVGRLPRGQWDGLCGPTLPR
jgi:hypothetical protein